MAGMGQIGSMTNFDAGTCDIVGIYIYPGVRGKWQWDWIGPGRLNRMIEIIKERSPATPFMGICQGFVGVDYVPRPTPKTLRKQLMDYVRHGAAAVGIWGWRYRRPLKGLSRYPDLVKEVRAIGADIRSGKIMFKQ